MEIFIFIIGMLFGGLLSYDLYFSPRRTIKRLWREIHKIIKFKQQIEIPGDSVATYLVTPASLDESIIIKKNLINSLLDYHFDKEKDDDYIRNNKP